MEAVEDAAAAVQRLISSSDSSEAAQVEAAAALARLAIDGGAKQCAAIVAAGAAGPLVKLLQSSSILVHRQAAYALQALARSGEASACDAIAAAGAIPALAPLLQSGMTTAAALAAGAMGALARCSDESAKAILAAGALPALIQLCGSSDQGAKAAVVAVCNLASRAACKQAIADAGGINALAGILASSGGSSYSASGSGGSSGEPAHAIATIALNNLASDSDTMKAAIAAAEGLPAALVRLLQDAQASQQAASAIHNLVSSAHPAACAAVAAAGGIAALAEQLAASCSSSDSDVHAWLAAGLAGLAHGSPERCGSILSSGCVPCLVRLLGSDAGEVQANAVAALSDLASRGGSAAIAVIAAAGATPALLALLSRSKEDTAAVAAGVICALAGAGQCSAAQAAAALPALDRLRSSSNSLIRGLASHAMIGLRRLCGADHSGTAASGQPQAAQRQQPQRPPRACAAPGCSITAGLRRCGGCGTVRYCSETCCKAHWRAHKPECRRLQAERAAAAAQPAAPAQGGGAVSQH